ncbi:hypothetical protein E8E15_001159 [Penicillium rubens]|nr:hypothetical protein E8E15_001159 [Penicillium rubens]
MPSSDRDELIASSSSVSLEPDPKLLVILGYHEIGEDNAVPDQQNIHEQTTPKE